MAARGITNNNPGNIRRGQPWNGLSADQPDPAFDRFDHAVYGIRAIAKILLTYQRRESLATIRKMIARWAPPVENDTGAYVEHAAYHVGVGADAPIDLDADAEAFARLVEVIIRHENGEQPYPAWMIRDGITLALS